MSRQPETMSPLLESLISDANMISNQTKYDAKDTNFPIDGIPDADYASKDAETPSQVNDAFDLLKNGMKR